MLNTDQQEALSTITRWWGSSKKYMILEGKGGTGKTYLVNSLIPLLKFCTPLFLAPTHEALDQLREKITDSNEYTFKTIHSALGITPTTHKKDVEFELRNIPAIWDDHNLAIIDESSMIPEWILQILIDLGIKILFIGHRSQLPSVDTNRDTDDPCDSPVFTKHWPIVTLTIPQRNVGNIWNFNNHVEKMITDTSLDFPNDYNISRKKLMDTISSDQGILDLKNGDLKIVLWSNRGVDFYNRTVRKILYGTAIASANKYVEGDKIILTSPCTLIPNMGKYKDTGIFAYSRKKDNDFLYSNTKGEVVSCVEMQIKLNSEITIDCYHIVARVKDKLVQLYSIKKEEERLFIKEYYEHRAWHQKTKKAKEKAYRERNFLLSCFAEIKHYFAATSHRLQGASVPKIIVIYGDIMRVKNRVERYKCLYVATSRTETDLKIYRGL